MSSSRFFNSHAARFASTLLVGAFSIGSTTALTGAARADYLVVAPHPDDDIITAAGVTLRARQAGTVVWVAYMTNGDSFVDPNMMTTAMQWGRQRGDEAVESQRLLGGQAAHCLFLGYPDGSIQDLFSTTYRSTPFPPQVSGQSTLTYSRTGSVPYSQIRTGAPVAITGNNVAADLLHILQEHPISDIFVVAPADQHPDHRATGLFVTEAVNARGSDTTIHYAYVWDAFDYVWPLAPNPATLFTEPTLLANKADPQQIGYVWSERESLDVPLAMQLADTALGHASQNLKARAINGHLTQGGFTGLRDQGQISAFVHKDEFFFPRRLVGTGANRLPSSRTSVANAGSDRSAAVGAIVTLDGTGSLPAAGRSLTYVWRQAEGPTATLSGAATATPSLTVAPSASGATLTFELRVNDGLSTSVPDAVSVRVGGTPPPDAGTPPPVDSGTPPPVDAGTPPVDSGTLDSGSPPPVDAGTLPADSGSGLDATVTADSGNPSADSGSTQVDAGAQRADAGTFADSGVALDGGAIADAGTRLDAGASILDAGTPPDLVFGGGTSAWPGDEDFDQDVRNIVEGDGSAAPNANKGSGCGIAADSSEAPFSVLTLALGLCASRLRRRRASSRI